MSFLFSILFFNLNSFACIDLSGEYSCLETPTEFHYDQSVQVDKTDEVPTYAFDNLLITGYTKIIADGKVHPMEQDQILSEGTYMANCSDQSLKFEIQAGVRDSDDIKLGDITSKYEVFFNEKNELVMKYDDVFKPVSGSSNTQNTVSICTKN